MLHGKGPAFAHAVAHGAAPSGQRRRPLGTRWLGRQLHGHEVIGSTQDEARCLATAGAPGGTVVWAREQTAGRGRIDRRWISPAGSGLWFSVVLRPELDAADAPFITIVTGVAIADALRRAAHADVRLKWPNDLLLRGRKVGGILVEAPLAGGRVEWVVVGVGINVRHPPGGFDASVRDTAIALDEVAPARDPSALLGACLRSLERRYDQYLAEGAEPARRRWLRLSATVGREVAAQLGPRVIKGTAVGLDPDGALVVRTPLGDQRVSAGEVIHLR